MVLMIKKWISIKSRKKTVFFLISKFSLFENMQIKSQLHLCVLRQCGPMVRALAVRSGYPWFKTRSDHWLNLCLVVPGSTSQLYFK